MELDAGDGAQLRRMLQIRLPCVGAVGVACMYGARHWLHLWHRCVLTADICICRTWESCRRH
jgi:hypothetical protein